VSEALNVQSGPWRAALGADQALAAATVAREVAARLRDRAQIEAANVAAAQQTAFPKSVYWEPHGVAQGDAGLALMCSYLDACFPGEGWDVTAHRYLTLAAQGAEHHSGYLAPGIFGGLSGLAFAAWSLSCDGTRYQRLLRALEEPLLPQTTALAGALSQHKEGVSVGQLDVISGLSGVGVYLLCRRDNEEAATALQAVLRGLVALTGQEEGGIPRWHTPAHLMSDEEVMLRLYPNGNLNCGLAHGIPGPLALMALAMRSGVEVEGLKEAIERVAGWLISNRVDDAWGVNWPIAVPVAPGSEPAAASSLPEEPSRSAWCYGSPGVARALWFAGEALDRPEYRRLAVEATEAVYRRPLRERAIDSPTFCHGVAGLLQITLRFARDTGLPSFAEAASTLSEQLLSLYDPDSLLGYYSLEPGGQRVDQPGLLDGAPGVVLVLLAAATDVEPTWDRLFLLA
jgi:lantibiotic biosynthesis protein